MKITEKILSLPPYLSTSWKNVFSCQVENRPYGHVLVLELVTGSKVEIPNLPPPVIEQIFTMHAKVVDEEGSVKMTTQTFAFPFPLPLEGLTSVLQHNPEQSDTPPLPLEILEKFQSLKGALPEDLSSFAKAEPHCNCPYCQVIRAFHDQEGAPAQEALEEEVTEKDLAFRPSWEIKQENDKLYSVTSTRGTEHYSVFLGNPVGCTCGSKDCEHIQAVLRS